MLSISRRFQYNQSFNLNIFLTANSLHAEFVSFDDLLVRSDFVFVACPLNDETRNMFDTAAFAKMKSTSVFVNVARGGMRG